MSAFWRAAGLTYVSYSSIAARLTRQALKQVHQVRTAIMPPFSLTIPTPAPQDVATKRGVTSVKFQKWEAGKPVGAKY